MLLRNMVAVPTDFQATDFSIKNVPVPENQLFV
jgi:hypothetical protein